MLVYLRSTGRIWAAKVDRLERAYFDERHAEGSVDLRMPKIDP